MKKLIFYICCMLLNVTLYSQINQVPDEVNTLNGKMVDKEQALIVAKHFLNERIVNQQLEKSADVLTLADVTTLDKNGLPALYVFSSQNKGFVIVSADKALTPVIGYSSEGVFPEKGVSPNFDNYLETYLGQVEWVRKQPQSETPEIQAQWKNYLAGEADLSIKTTNDIGPLLTCLWDQTYPYNALCPEVSGTEGNVPAGCGATAMSMIMYYYRYPIQGTGVNSYNAPGYGTQYVNFGTASYNWDGMLDQINDGSGQSIPAVALLQYHAGVSINMYYSPSYSGAQSNDVPSALIQHFGYNPLAQYIKRENYTFTNWENIVVGQLDSLNPVYYQGFAPNKGHAFVCDGYQVSGSTKMFHFNFGSSGLGNGYYTLSNPDGYTIDQGLIRDFYPASGYPYGCSSHIISDANGSFEDGSSPKFDYKPGLNCTWLIDPDDSVSKISLTFNAFNVDSSDSVFIYDGKNEKAALLGVYSGTTIPPTINSSSNKLFLKFNTDGSNQAKGWTAEYHSVYPIYCNGMTTLTSPSGSFSNGSGEKNYNNNSNCKWRIQPPDAGAINLSFNSFDLEEHDKLMVYSVGASTVLLGTFTGKVKPDPIVSPTGALLLIFNANGYNTAAGFDANYTSTLVGTEELDISTAMTLYPNPATNKISIATNSNLQGETTICIFNMNGKILRQEIFQSQNLIELDVSTLTKGFYLVKIQTNKEIESKKLVVQ